LTTTPHSSTYEYQRRCFLSQCVARLKKLEAGNFAWPKVPEGAAKIALRAEALEMLLSGIELKGGRLRPWYEDPSAAAALSITAKVPAAPAKEAP